MKKLKLTLALLAGLVFSAPATGDAARLVGFGDSNTDGTNFKTYYPNNMDDRWIVLTNGLNSGVSGNTSQHGRNRFVQDVLYKYPTVVTIMFNTNDAVLQADGTPKIAKEQYEANIRYFVRELKKRGIKPILMTTVPVVQSYFYERHPQERYSGYGGARLWFDSYNNITRKVAYQEGVRLIDNYENTVLKAGGATDYKLNQSGLIDRTGTHFSPRGHGMISWSVNYVIRTEGQNG